MTAAQSPEPPARTQAVLRFASRRGSRLVICFIGVGLGTGLGELIAGVLHLPAVVGALLATAGATAAYVGLVRLLERRAVEELAPRRLLEALLGLGAGVALFSVTIGALALLGCYHVESVGSLAAAAPMVAMALVSAVSEELLLRGVVFRIGEELAGTWASLAFSAAFFGLAHLANPHGTLLAAAAIALEAGVLLAAAYLNGRALWLPIGIHAGWNFTQGGIFGVAVSGGKVEGWLHGKLTGPWWLSGDEFGAEASVVAVAVCLSLAIPLLVRAYRKGEWRPAPWSRLTSPGER